MYLEEKVDLIFSEVGRLLDLVELFLPDLKTERGVIHFLEITKNTLNTYLKDAVLIEGVHYIVENKRRVYIPDEIVILKKCGVKGSRKAPTKNDKLEAVNVLFGIMPVCRSAV